MRKITKLFLASLLMLLTGAFGNAASAQTVTNGGFETGSLTPWAVTSGVSVSTGFTELSWTITPSGSGMARIEVTPSLMISTAESNLGLAAGSLVALNSSIFGSGPSYTSTNFGTMTQTITLAAGQTVIAYWNYVSRDYSPFNDGVIATLVGPSYQNVKILSVSTNAYGSGAIVTGSYGSTGWFPVTFTAGAAGTYKLGFACFNSGDQAVNPILCIDNAAGGTSAPGMPIVLTSAISSTSCTTASCGGNVTSDGGSLITDKGVCWNTTGLPTIADAHTNEGSGSGTFSSTITGLAPATTYYVRSYATNVVGISYGPEVTIVSTPAISGTLTTCQGSTTTLSSVGSGSWTSMNTSVATVGTSGVVTGVSPGTAVISYGTSTCADSKIVTVNPLPNAGTISGASSVCSGSTIALTTTGTGGSWSSTSPSVASVSASGVVTGSSVGSAVISYTVSNSCGTVAATQNVIVNPVPEAGEITGELSVCVDATTLLSSSSSEGTWSISNSNASISPLAGSVLGVSAGTSIVTFTSTTVCGTDIATAIVTINPLPNAGTITGAATVCTGTTLSLSNATSGGSWSSSSDNASVSSTGVVTGIAAGSATISYSVSNECGTAVATKDITVLAIPDAGTITGTASLCQGSTTTLSNTTTGGTWSSGYTATATVDASGVVTGVGAGNATISYRMTNFCGTSYATQVVTVNPLPNAGTIGGLSAVCEGSTITLPFISTLGSWSSSNPSVATIDNDTRVVTGLVAGSTTISFTVTNSCGTATATKDITVNPAPVAGSLSGASVICAGTSTTITPSVSGGTWLSSNAAIASVSTSGEVTGVAAGAVTISYRVTNSCGIATATQALTVNPAVAVGTIGGASSVCAGSNITLTNSTTGGTWSSSNTAAATVSSTGVVTGVAEGTTTISYTVTNSCGTATATKEVVVNPLPVAGTISGATTLCTGTTITLTTTGTGGSWISSIPTAASVSADGVVTGLATGATTITYRVINGCGTANATHAVTITAAPSVSAISGSSLVCAGNTISLSSTTAGGTWSSTAPSVATVGSTGVVTGVAAGSTTISYVVTGGCGTVAVTKDVTVLPLPNAGTISGTSPLCRTTTATFTSTVSGGTWSSSYAAGASVNASTGLVTGLANGNFIISYRMTNSCGTVYASYPVSIISAPVLAAISGATSVCESATTTLANTTTGGSWSSTNTSVATVDATTGVVTGVAGGSTTISYNVTNICGSATVGRVQTVNPLPVAAVISGTATLSAGATTTLTATPSGGTWLSGSSTIASVNTAGVVTGVAAGNATISYTRTNTCGSAVATVVVTVTAATTPITGVRVVCVGATTALANATAGGTWSTADGAIATVGTTGVVTGVGAGTTTVTYTFSGGGNVTATVTVNASPAAYTGSGVICTGSQLNLGSLISGCTWVSGNTARATVGNTTGIVTGGTTLGSVNITYTNAAACRTITQLTVNAGVALITGVSSPCIGNSITLGNATSGGTWSSSNTARATIDASTGVLTAVGGGTVTISYTVSAGCVRTTTVTVGTPPSITGNPSICFGQSSTLVSSGGTWSSSNTTIATVAANGIVTGVALGNAVITYRSTANALCFVTQEVTVNPLPSAIIAPPTLCPGQTATLTSSPAGGTWTSSFPTKASVDPTTGVVTAVIYNFTAISVVNISYTLPTGCGGIATVTVNPLPSPISGNRNICVAGSTTLTSSTTGGAWSSESTGVATVAAGGVVTGVSAGTARISYTNALGCPNTEVVTVNAMPGANTGSASLCLPGVTTTLSNPAGVGTWTSGNTTKATVNFNTGVVTGVNTGTANITYTKAAGCISVTQVTVTICGARPGMSEDTDGNNSVFSVSPNPTTGAISLTTDVVGKVVIYTIDGKELQQYEAKAGTTSITMPAGLANGVYLLRFNGVDGSSKMVRLVYQQ